EELQAGCDLTAAIRIVNQPGGPGCDPAPFARQGGPVQVEGDSSLRHNQVVERQPVLKRDQNRGNGTGKVLDGRGVTLDTGNFSSVFVRVQQWYHITDNLRGPGTLQSDRSVSFGGPC